MSTRILVYSAVVIACISVFIPLLFKKRKDSSQPLPEEQEKRQNEEFAKTFDTPPPSLTADRPRKQNKNEAKKINQPKKRKSWLSSLLPFYGIGVFAYVLYIFVKMSTFKKNKIKEQQRKRTFQKSSRSNVKGKITEYELKQLEQRLMETEKNLELILSEAKTITKISDGLSNDSDDDLIDHVARKRKMSL